MNQDFYSYIFLALQERIKEQLPEIAHIDLDLSQDDAPQIILPAILIDFPDTDFSEIGYSDLFAAATISVRLLASPVSQSYADAPLDVRTEALSYFDLEHRLTSALHGWTPDNDICQPLILTKAQTTRATPQLRSRKLTLTTAYESTFS